jgi:omega-6 fatty acid desaturase (delta-12 desaturase)
MHAPDPFATATALTRREVVRALMPFTRRSTAKGVSLVAVELALYWLAILGVLYLPGWGWKIAAALFAGIRLGSFVVLGHDAAHGALTPHKRLNWLLGVAAFTSCFYNYRMWIYDHHVQHHSFTNHEQKDTYTPMTKAEFDALPRWRQLQQRFYRRPSFVSLAVYYIVERWSQAKVLPLPYVGASYRPAAWKHFAFLATYIALFTAALVLAPAYADVTTAQALLLGMLLPFFVFMGIQSYILWSMHTLPDVGWFRPGLSPAYIGSAGELVSVHVAFPRWLELFTHGITNHPVHHLLPAIPIYNLAKAQAKYEALVGPLNVKHPFSLAGLVDTANRCKLYDFDQNRWLDFEGNPTGTLTRPFCNAERVAQYLGKETVTNSLTA